MAVKLAAAWGPLRGMPVIWSLVAAAVLAGFAVGVGWKLPQVLLHTMTGSASWAKAVGGDSLPEPILKLPWNVSSPAREGSASAQSPASQPAGSALDTGTAQPPAPALDVPVRAALGATNIGSSGPAAAPAGGSSASSGMGSAAGSPTGGAPSSGVQPTSAAGSSPSSPGVSSPPVSSQPTPAPAPTPQAGPPAGASGPPGQSQGNQAGSGSDQGNGKDNGKHNGAANGNGNGNAAGGGGGKDKGPKKP